MSEIQEVTDISELRSLIESEPNLVVKYWATWCGPCKMYAPTFALASEKVPDAKFVAVDIDKVPEVSADYGVMSVPQTHQFRDGNPAVQMVGAQRLVPLVQALS